MLTRVLQARAARSQLGRAQREMGRAEQRRE